jgi:hypothetical protein
MPNSACPSSAPPSKAEWAYCSFNDLGEVGELRTLRRTPREQSSWDCPLWAACTCSPMLFTSVLCHLSCGAADQGLASQIRLSYIPKLGAILAKHEMGARLLKGEGANPLAFPRSLSGVSSRCRGPRQFVHGRIFSRDFVKI